MEFTNAIKSKKGTILISIYVTPAAKKTCFPTGYNEWRKTLEMSVKGKAENNKANLEVLKEISRFFNTPFSKISITAGKTSREKIISLQTLSQQQVIQKISEHLDE